MTIHFDYNKAQVIQALRYHFISRKEIRIMIILVNVFAILSFVLYLLKYILPVAFLIGAVLWIVLMISFWFLMPSMVYKRAATFREQFSMNFQDDGFTLAHEKGSKSWPWTALSNYLETPNFFHLYFDTRSFFLVPKSGCKTDDEVYELRNIIKSHVKKG
jgi:hypothetical protein